jgi:hypothetical protein
MKKQFVTAVIVLIASSEMLAQSNAQTFIPPDVRAWFQTLVPSIPSLTEKSVIIGTFHADSQFAYKVTVQDSGGRILSSFDVPNGGTLTVIGTPKAGSLLQDNPRTWLGDIAIRMRNEIPFYKMDPREARAWARLAPNRSWKNVTVLVERSQR